MRNRASSEQDEAQNSAAIDQALVAFQRLEMQNSQISARVAAALGVSGSDVRALVFIAGNPGATPKQVAAYLELSTGAITNVLDRMTGAGFVRRVPNPNDRRSVLLELARPGEEAVDRIGDFYRRAFRDALDPSIVEMVTAAFHSIGNSLARESSTTIVE